MYYIACKLKFVNILTVIYISLFEHDFIFSNIFSNATGDITYGLFWFYFRDFFFFKSVPQLLAIDDCNRYPLNYFDTRF